MSDDLTARVEAEISRWIPLTRANLVGIPEAARAIAALIAEREAVARKEGCAWAEAVERWFNVWDEAPDWSANPHAEIGRMVAWEQTVALDPAVSEDARTLIAEAREAGRREGLEEAAQDVDCGCECRPMVLMALASGHPRAERDAQNVCTSKPGDCLALAAASIRALATEPRDAE